jgi:hypothetical protein
MLYYGQASCPLHYHIVYHVQRPFSDQVSDGMYAYDGSHTLQGVLTAAYSRDRSGAADGGKKDSHAGI